jgi:hypothetical protein
LCCADKWTSIYNTCSGGQAGAVDEESFIEAFEDVKKVVDIFYIYSSLNLFELASYYSMLGVIGT